MTHIKAMPISKLCSIKESEPVDEFNCATQTDYNLRAWDRGLNSPSNKAGTKDAVNQLPGMWKTNIRQSRRMPSLRVAVEVFCARINGIRVIKYQGENVARH